jgi:hypothetical protein
LFSTLIFLSILYEIKIEKNSTSHKFEPQTLN